MPRKKFEDAPYDPIAADLAREVGATGRAGGLLPTTWGIEKQPEKAQVLGNAALRLEKEHAVVPKTRGHEPSITKRFVVSRSEDSDLTTFLNRLQSKAGTKVTLSVLVRAALGVTMQAEEQLLAEIGDRFSMDLPSTHDSIAQAEFEDRWMKVLTSAFRKLPRSGRV